MLFMKMYNFKRVYIAALGISLVVLLSVNYMYENNADKQKPYIRQQPYRRQQLYRRQQQNFQFCNRTQYYMLPGDSIIDKMDDKALYLTFARYINQKQILCCNVSRVGPTGTSGKNMCLDNLKNKQNGCLVYSFDSEFRFDFETAIYKSYQCEVHTFDPSMAIEGKTIPEGVHFHLQGLSNRDKDISAPKTYLINSVKIWKMRTLSTILKSLGHSKRIIDILKIDIEGWEWNALPQMIQSGVLKNVKQLCLEVHFGYSLEYTFQDKMMVGYNFSADTWGNVAVQNQLKTLKKLHDYGFRIFMFDPIQQWAIWPVKDPVKYINTLVEISLVNLNV